MISFCHVVHNLPRELKTGPPLQGVFTLMFIELSRVIDNYKGAEANHDGNANEYVNQQKV